MIKEYELKNVDYVITNEAGASVYSASKLATEEFPDFDVSQRSAAIHSKTYTGSVSRACKDRSKVYRCRPVSA